MALLMRLLPFLVLAGVVVWLLRRPAPRAEPKCASCRHCGSLFDDGVLCRYGTKETFKNNVHIENCTDHSPR